MSFFFSDRKSCHCRFLFCTVIINAPRLTSFSFFLMQNQYNLARAQQSYKSLVQIHEKNGECFLSPVSYGGHYWPCLLKPNPSHASKLSKISACALVYGLNMDKIPFLQSICDWYSGSKASYYEDIGTPYLWLNTTNHTLKSVTDTVIFHIYHSLHLGQ